MRWFRVLLLWPCVVGLFLLTRVAAADRPRVVVVRTEDSRGWPTAERRLLAEFGAIGVDVVALPDREGADRELPQYAATYGAIMAVQVLRRGDNGLVRFWAPEGSGGQGKFRHISLNLRNPDVLNRAVLPVVEFVYERLEEVPGDDSGTAAGETPSSEQVLEEPEQAHKPTPKPAKSASESLVPSYWAGRFGWVVGGEPVRYHVRSQMRYALRVGAGPWFSGAGTTPAVNVVLGVRAHWFTTVALEAETFAQPIAHRVEVLGGVGDLRLFGVRGHLLYEPWPNSNVGLGFGPGAGMFWVVPKFPFEEAASRHAPFVSLRSQIASALMPFFDIVFTFEVNGALTPIAGYSLTTPDAKLMRVGLDSMVAVDWHWD